MDLVGTIGDLVFRFGVSAFDVIAGGIGWVVGLAADLLIIISAALPDGGIFELPEVAGQWETGLGWLNWWLPIGQIAAVMAAWLAAVLVYYAWQLKLRKFVGSGK